MPLAWQSQAGNLAALRAIDTGLTEWRKMMKLKEVEIATILERGFMIVDWEDG